MIPAEWLDNYEDVMSSLDEGLRADLLADLERVDLSDIAAAREAFIEIMEYYLSGYTDLTAEVSATFYETVRESQVGEEYTALRDTGRISGATAAAVYSIMQVLVDGGAPEEVHRQLLDRASFEIRRAAGANTLINVRADPKKPRFARVPQYSKTYGAGCPFCRMLASRGFVYYSASAAGGFNHYHADCRCKVVPSWDKSGVEGYDPNAYANEYLASKVSKPVEAYVLTGRKYARVEAESGIVEVMGKSKEQWQQAAAKAKSGSAENAERYQGRARVAYGQKRMESGKGYWPRKRVDKTNNAALLGELREAEFKEVLRSVDKKSVGSWDSIVNGYFESVSSAKGSVSAQFRADIKGHEIVVASWLTEYGYDVRFLRASKLPGSHTPDILLDGVPYEIKRVESKNADAVFRNCWQASSQSENVIIDISLGTVSYDDAYSQAQKVLTSRVHKYLSKYEKKMGASYGEARIRVKNVMIVYNGEITKVKA